MGIDCFEINNRVQIVVVVVGRGLSKKILFKRKKEKRRVELKAESKYIM